MADTSIEWTDKSWNPLAAYFEGKRGWMCSKPSPGCKNCYSERLNLRLGNGLRYTPENVAKVAWHVVNLDEPGRWRKPQRVFVESMGDLFHEALPDDIIGRIWGAMLSYPKHTFQVLTKRAERMREIVTRLRAEGERKGLREPDHIWLGVSVENQEQADKRIPELLKIPARVRFLSCEPLLEPIDFVKIGYPHPLLQYHCRRCDARVVSSRCPVCQWDAERTAAIDWVIAGGESGPNARPSHPDWARSLRDQCQTAGVPFFYKQTGEWLHWSQARRWKDTQIADWAAHGAPAAGFADERAYVWGDNSHSYRVGKKRAGRLLDGVEHNGFPEVSR